MNCEFGLNFSHSLYDFYPTGLYFRYKTPLPFYLLLHSILKRKKRAQVVYFGPKWFSAGSWGNN